MSSKYSKNTNNWGKNFFNDKTRTSVVRFQFLIWKRDSQNFYSSKSTRINDQIYVKENGTIARIYLLIVVIIEIIQVHYFLLGVCIIILGVCNPKYEHTTNLQTWLN